MTLFVTLFKCAELLVCFELVFFFPIKSVVEIDCKVHQLFDLK